MSAQTERDPMDSFNVIISTVDPLTDRQVDTLVSYLAEHAPVVDGDGTITLTITTKNTQNLALAEAVGLVLMFDYLTVSQVEAMTTEVYDETYGFGL